MSVYDHRNTDFMYAYSYTEEPTKQDYCTPVCDDCEIITVGEFVARVKNKNITGAVFPMLDGMYAKGINIGTGYQFQLDVDAPCAPSLATHVVIFKS